jgi:hypothetical protein
MALIHQGPHGNLGPRQGGPTTKSLNTGISQQGPTGNVANGINFGAATGVNYYYSATAGGILMKLNPSPIPILTTTTTPWIITSVPPVTFGPVPTFDASGVTPPTTAAGSQAGGTVPSGTYYVATTFVSPLGESLPSPTVAVTVTGPQEIVITAVPNDPRVIITLELTVPRLEDWHVTRYAVLLSNAAFFSGATFVGTQPAVFVYVDSLSLINLLDSSPIGAQNSANADIMFRPGQLLICQWLYATPGTVGTFSVFGSKIS